MADLAALLSRIEAAEGPSYELFDTAATTLVHGGGELLPWFAHFHDLIKYRAYLDACAELQARVLPGWNWHLSKEDEDEGPWAPRAIAAVNTKPVWDDATEDYIPKRAANAPGATPALAWLAALVRALIDQHGGE